MINLPRMMALVLAFALLGCATHYGEQDLTGGYDEKQIAPDIWGLGFSGNGFTSRETVQTFWLYRAAELTLAHGYGGFEILSDINLVSYRPGAEVNGAHLYNASDTTTFVPTGLPQGDKPQLFARIRMLHGEVTAYPPRIFNAAELKAALEPLVKGPLCDGNVCPHVHGYLHPALKT